MVTSVVPNTVLVKHLISHGASNLLRPLFLSVLVTLNNRGILIFHDGKKLQSLIKFLFLTKNFHYF